MKPKAISMSSEEVVAALASSLATDISRLIDNHVKDLGPEAPIYFSSQFVAAFVTARACSALMVPEGVAREVDQYAIVSKNFENFKMAVQEATSSGFSAAMSHFSGRTAEYYCQINLVPEPLSKTVN